MSDTLVPPEGQTSFSGIPAAQFIGEKNTFVLVSVTHLFRNLYDH